MSNGGEEGAPDLSGWEPFIRSAIDLADQFPEQYRVPIVEAVLRSRAGGTFTLPEEGSWPVEESGHDAREEQDGLQVAADAADVEVGALRRIVRITDEDDLDLLARVHGNSTAERCRKAAVVYAYLQEKAFGLLDIDIEELREVVDKQSAYDSPNFTRHLRSKDLLMEMGTPGTSQKQYRLSPKGEEAAKEFIRELVEQ